MEDSMEFPLKTTNRTTICPSNPTPRHISGQNYNSERYMHPYVLAALFTIAKAWKQPNCPSTAERIKMWHIYIYTHIHTHAVECYPAIKKCNNAIHSNMHAATDYHTKSVRKTQRTDLWLLAVGGGSERECRFGVSRCKLSHIEETNNEVQLYSTGNYI